MKNKNTITRKPSPYKISAGTPTPTTTPNTRCIYLSAVKLLATNSQLMHCRATNYLYNNYYYYYYLSCILIPLHSRRRILIKYLFYSDSLYIFILSKKFIIGKQKYNNQITILHKNAQGGVVMV